MNQWRKYLTKTMTNQSHLRLRCISARVTVDIIYITRTKLDIYSLKVILFQKEFDSNFYPFHPHLYILTI